MPYGEDEKRNMRNFWQDESFARKFAFAIVSIILFQIVATQPFFGLMDDATNLNWIVPDIKNNGLISFIIKYQKQDFVWGMFRPLYPPMVYFLYSIGTNFGPIIFFLLNAVIVFFILFLNAKVLGKFSKINHWYIFILTFAYPYTYDLFQHPSLQEKLVHLFGALLLYLSFENTFSLRRKAIWFTTVLTLGISSKASFIFYIGLSFVAFAANLRQKFNQKNIVNALYCCILLVFASAFLIHVTRSGGYTSHYNLQKIPGNLFSKHGLFFSLLIILGLISVVRWRKILSNTEELIPWCGVSGFFILYLPWGLYGYLLSLAAPFIATLVLQILQKTMQSKNAWLFPILTLSLLMALWRPYVIFMRLHDIRDIITHADELKEKGVEKIFMSCPEGSESMNAYFSKFTKSGIHVEHLDVIQTPPRFSMLYDSSMCTFTVPKAWQERCEQSFLKQSKYRGGYQLLHFRCKA